VRTPERHTGARAPVSSRLTLGETLRAAAIGRGLALAAPAHPEPLAHLEYADELSLKNGALSAFWKAHALERRPEEIVPAPRPRGYRTTTKRRAFLRRGGLALAFSASSRPQAGVAPSALDPPEHLAIYEFLFEMLARPASAALAVELNYVIVRGAAEALAVILNVRAFGAAIVRRAKQIGEALAGAALGVRSAFLYLDPTGSDYYLETRRPAGVLSSKCLFGPERLEVSVDGVRLAFPPVVFSQVNGAMLPAITATAGGLLGPLAGKPFLDLYCGYGLFSLTVGREAATVLGVDTEGPAIEAARENARRTGMGARARFLAGRIASEWLSSRLPRRGRAAEIIILDPPRQGTAPGVVAEVAARCPERVVHVFCGTDEIPRELKSWRQSGYRVARVAPLDLFPGTASLETMVLLVPTASAASPGS
jgi:tRNA/tmRNA/rRNA uracil-C5-methylase (TrmA/RlmC/RlmD family)